MTDHYFSPDPAVFSSPCSGDPVAYCSLDETSYSFSCICEWLFEDSFQFTYARFLIHGASRSSIVMTGPTLSATLFTFTVPVYKLSSPYINYFNGQFSSQYRTHAVIRGAQNFKTKFLIRYVRTDFQSYVDPDFEYALYGQRLIVPLLVHSVNITHRNQIKDLSPGEYFVVGESYVPAYGDGVSEFGGSAGDIGMKVNDVTYVYRRPRALESVCVKADGQVYKYEYDHDALRCRWRAYKSIVDRSIADAPIIYALDAGGIFYAWSRLVSTVMARLQSDNYTISRLWDSDQAPKYLRPEMERSLSGVVGNISERIDSVDGDRNTLPMFIPVMKMKGTEVSSRTAFNMMGYTGYLMPVYVRNEWSAILLSSSDPLIRIDVTINRQHTSLLRMVRLSKNRVVIYCYKNVAPGVDNYYNKEELEQIKAAITNAAIVSGPGHASAFSAINSKLNDCIGLINGIFNNNSWMNESQRLILEKIEESISHIADAKSSLESDVSLSYDSRTYAVPILNDAITRLSEISYKIRKYMDVRFSVSVYGLSFNGNYILGKSRNYVISPYEASPSEVIRRGYSTSEWSLVDDSTPPAFLQVMDNLVARLNSDFAEYNLVQKISGNSAFPEFRLLSGQDTEYDYGIYWPSRFLQAHINNWDGTPLQLPLDQDIERQLVVKLYKHVVPLGSEILKVFATDYSIGEACSVNDNISMTLQ